MSKAKSGTGYYLKLALTLLVISAVVSGLLGLTNFVTKDKIAAINADKTAASMKEVLPADTYTQLEYPATGSQANVAAVYQADDKGYVIEVTPSGFGGTIDMVVGVGHRRHCHRCVHHQPCPRPPAWAQTPARRASGVSSLGKTGGLAVSKDGGEIDAHHRRHHHLPGSHRRREYRAGGRCGSAGLRRNEA